MNTLIRLTVVLSAQILAVLAVLALQRIAHSQERMANYAALEAAVELDTCTDLLTKGRLSLGQSKN